MRKKILYYCLCFGFVSFVTGNSMNVNAQSILETEKPLMIIEEQQPSKESPSILDNTTTISSGGLLGDKANSSNVGNKEESTLMTPNELLGYNGTTISEFENLIVSRLLDVIRLFQKVAKPLCIIFFILSAISVVTSIVFDGRKARQGFLGMMFSILAYVGIMYAPELVLFFSQWLSI